jgi:anti-anti-sigma factor
MGEFGLWWQVRSTMETQDALAISTEGDIAIACFARACICDSDEIARASASLRRHIETRRPAALVFDFAGVKFFSSQVLGLLLEARARLQPHGGRVAVAALSPQLERVFRITNLDQLFAFYPDRPTALQQLSGSRG